MYIIIIGCGRLGRGIAIELSSKDNDVVVIDRDKGKLENLNVGYDGQKIKGIEFDNDILNEAGIKKADVFLALTSDDNTNILASKIAKEIYGVKNVIARVCNFNKESIYKSMGIDTVNTNGLGISIIKNKIINDEYKEIAVLDSQVSIIEISITHNKVININQIESKYKCSVSAFIKDNNLVSVFLNDEVLKKDDKVVCTVQDQYKTALINSL